MPVQINPDELQLIRYSELNTEYQSGDLTSDFIVAIEYLNSIGKLRLSELASYLFASTEFTGTPTAPTPLPGNDTDRIATTAFVTSALASAGLSVATVGDFGSVKINSADPNPIVYLRSEVDSLLTSKASSTALNNAVTDITANQNSISDNTSDITDIENEITNINTNIGNNASNISGNTSNISANTTGINSLNISLGLANGRITNIENDYLTSAGFVMTNQTIYQAPVILNNTNMHFTDLAANTMRVNFGQQANDNKVDFSEDYGFISYQAPSLRIASVDGNDVTDSYIELNHATYINVKSDIPGINYSGFRNDTPVAIALDNSNRPRMTISGTDFGEIQMNAVSDRRLKSDINAIDESWANDLLLELNPVSFKYIDGKMLPKGLKYGLIAQEVAAIDSNLVIQGDEESQYLGVEYSALVPILLAAINRLSRKVKELEEVVI